MNRAAASLLAVSLAIFAGWQGLAPLTAQTASTAPDLESARQALDIARQQQRNARLRAENLEQETARAEEAEAKALSEAAALAARVQQAEAGVAAAQAELALVSRESAAPSTSKLVTVRCPISDVSQSAKAAAPSWLGVFICIRHFAPGPSKTRGPSASGASRISAAAPDSTSSIRTPVFSENRGSA